MIAVNRLRPRAGSCRLDGAVEKTRQALANDGFGLGHDAVDQFLYRRNVVDQADYHAAAPGARVHVAVDHDLGIDADDLLENILELERLTLLALDLDQAFDTLVGQHP